MLKSNSSSRRNTRIKSALLDIFTGGGIFSVPELLDTLNKKGIKANKTTLYRQLEKLSEEKSIENVSILPGIKHYEKTETLGHHHHLVCEQCKKIEHVHSDQLELSMQQMEDSLKREFHFSFLSHSLSFFGLCKNCSA
jgi:Fur family transcriptional regulator, ferric uptake regulator